MKSSENTTQQFKLHSKTEIQTSEIEEHFARGISERSKTNEYVSYRGNRRFSEVHSE